MSEGKDKVGRPSAFKEEYIKQAEKLCELGATDSEMADFFNVDVRTLQRWKVDNKEFCHSVKIGKDVADDRVEMSLYHRATGYSHPEDDIRVIEGQIVITPTIKHYPPDTTAMIYWLKNRRKDDWRDKTEVEHSVDETIVDRILAARQRASQKD
jgi:hypothetical protein